MKNKLISQCLQVTRITVILLACILGCTARGYSTTLLKILLNY